MSHYQDRERIWSLIINTIDRLEQIERTKELTNIIWEINISNSKTEQDWRKVEVLLESYEKNRDEYLAGAMSNLRELVQIMTS